MIILNIIFNLFICSTSFVNFLNYRYLQKFSKNYAVVEVYDDVFSRSVCEIIDNEAKAGRPIGHSLYYMDTKPRSVIELAMRNILNQLGDKSNTVEYWWRDEWMNLEMHRDIDERLGLTENILRCPENAHVLYLHVGEEVQGPTVIFRDHKLHNGTFDQCIVVPAVQGRLLRFQGDMMHAVPRPSLAYFDPVEGGSNLELWTRKIPNHNDPNDPENNIFRRSVLLFNTWMTTPPLDIPAEIPTGTLLEHAKTNVSSDCMRLSGLNKLDLEIGVNTPIDSLAPTDLVRLKIGILGNAIRRERSSRYLDILAPRALKDLFNKKGGLPGSLPIEER